MRRHYYLEDFNSRNGTFLNGRPVSERELLPENDEVQICDLAFIFHLSPAEVAARPPDGRGTPSKTRP